MNRLRKIKIGIIGCGAIGSSVALTVSKRFSDKIQISALCDIKEKSAQALAEKLGGDSWVCLQEKAIEISDLIIETSCVSDAFDIVKKALTAGKDVLVLSVGGILKEFDTLKNLSAKTGAKLYVPSGALSGIDAIKAVKEDIEEVTLITRKPARGLRSTPFLQENGIDVDKIKNETKLFEGNPQQIIKRFPKNVNVSAILSLAVGDMNKVKVQLFTSPEYKRNSHEIIVKGDFGVIRTYSESAPSQDNPKTSKLAILSTISTISQIVSSYQIGS